MGSYRKEGGISIDIKTRVTWAAPCRYSIPPYPMEIEGHHAPDAPISGVVMEDAWRACYLYDAQLRDESLVIAGVFSHVCSPIGIGHSPKGT
jgi:hypothetical protein